MYFRRSLNKIVKVRPLVSSLRFCRYSHTGTTFSRRFCIANLKKNTTENEKTTSKSRSVGIDLLAPNFRSNYSTLKSISKNRKQIGSQFHTMPQKSLTLKMCKQPSKNLSTSYTNANHDQTKEKTKKKDEIPTIVARSKSDICKIICGPNSSNFTTMTIDLAPSSRPEVPEKIIDKLSDADVEEICKTRCPCRDSDASDSVLHKKKSTQNIKGRPAAECSEKSTTNQSSRLQDSSKEKFEGLSPSTAQLSKKSEELATTTIQSAVGSQDSSSTSQSSKKLDGFATTIPSTTSDISKIRKLKTPTMTSSRTPNMQNRQRHPPTSQYRFNMSVANDYRQPPRIDPIMTPSGQNDGFIPRPLADTVHPTQSLPLRASNQLKSNYMRMIRFKQLSHIPFRYLPTHELQIQPSQLQIFQRQVNVNTNSRSSFTENVCHFEQLKPVPFRYRPIYPKNYHSDPVVKSIAPRVGAMYVGVPYKPPQWQKRQTIRKKSVVFGSTISRNRQTVDIPPTMPNWITSPIEFADKAVNNVNVTADNVKGIALPILQNASMKNFNVEKGPLANPPIDTELQSKSRKIMSKLVENLSVVIEGPTKLKLVTSPYPRLRNETDVIIQMEYVNLTDADTRHYLTGKYNSYSYATTAIGRTGSGVIIETGKNVRNVKAGDKVFVKPISCGKCALCLSDRRNVCEYITVSELSPIQGILTRLHVHSSDFVTKIPNNVSVLNGALTWTLSAAIRACQKANISAGDVVMVIGGGPLGTATGFAAQLMGATTVCLADTRQPVLDEARKLGIDKVFQIDPKSPSRNTAIKVWEQIGDYPRVTFDCRGSRLTNEIAIDSTQTGGKVVVMTNSEVGIPLPISNLVSRDIDIIISTCGNDESDIAALRFLSTRKISFGNFMSKHYDFSNIQEAVEHLYGPNRLDSQIIIKCGCMCGNDKRSEEKKSEQKI